MNKIIGILLLSVCVTAGAAACGSSGIALEETMAAVTAAADETADAAPDGDTALADAQDAAAEGEPASICVYVCGAVVTPGVYSLQEGARIYEALQLAGGLTAEADISVVNQAQELSDGMMIRIPAIGERTEQDPVQTADGGVTGTDASGLVNINTADAAQLCTLPGIGETKAAAILTYREQHGSFTSKEELLNVSGIGDATYRNLESRIVVQ